MNVEERIARRRRVGDDPQLVRDYEALSPVVHVSEPTGRAAEIERLLDHVEPAFDGVLPDSVYVWGPPGAGKSAVVNALFSHLADVVGRSESVIHTTTRAADTTTVEFCQLDARTAGSEFRFLHALLDGLLDRGVPRQGVGTERLRERLGEELADPGRQVLVAVDHVDEPGTLSAATVEARLASVSPALSWLMVGRTAPDALSVAPASTTRFDSYESHVLVDVLADRVGRALTRRAIDHDGLRSVAEWAEGNAHDALSAVFGAVDHAVERRSGIVDAADLSVGMDAVPRPGVSLGRVLALADNHQRVLRRLVDLDDADLASVQGATDAIAAAPDLGLSEATVKRFLYELAEVGVTERVRTEHHGQGRPPSRIEPRFPTRVFRRLYDVRRVRSPGPR